MQIQKLLLIDDDEDDQEIFFAALSAVSQGIQFTGRYDAKEALTELREKKLSPDVIFLDLNMPVMNGQQFLKEIKNEPELKSIPVIIFSTSSHQPTIDLMMELGAQDFITKPDKFDKLKNVLNSFLNQF